MLVDHEPKPALRLKNKNGAPEDRRAVNVRTNRNDQLRALSTSWFLAIQGIMPRSLAPTSSIW